METREAGSISLDVLKIYFANGGGLFVFLLMLALFGAEQVCAYAEWAAGRGGSKFAFSACRARCWRLGSPTPAPPSCDHLAHPSPLAQAARVYVDRWVGIWFTGGFLLLLCLLLHARARLALAQRGSPSRAAVRRPRSTSRPSHLY